jgi:signal peptidase II
LKTKWLVAGLLAGGVLALDLWTKSWALATLAGGRGMELLGGWVPLTLAFNQGAAFGLRIGSDPRLVFIPVTILAVVFLALVILRSPPTDRLRIVAASLVLGGALGNLYDRVRWDRGVVDFIGPVDLGFMLWPIFNVADMGITVGAILLAISFWREDMARTPEEPGGEGPRVGGPGARETGGAGDTGKEGSGAVSAPPSA